MGVEEVYEYLNRKGGWHTIMQIAAAIDLSDGSVAKNLQILLKRKVVVRKEDEYIPQASYLWKAKT